MLSDALNYPYNSEDQVRTYGIATLLYITSILILPLFPLLGYFIKVTRKSLEGNQQMPKFENFPKLFTDGLKATVITVIYFTGSILAMSLTTSIGSQTAALPFFLLGLTLFLTVIYVLPSAFAELAREDSLTAAFNLKKVFRQAFTKQYLLGMTSIMAAGLLIGIAQLAITILLIVTVIGIPLLLIFIPAANFYQYTVYHRIIASATK